MRAAPASGPPPTTARKTAGSSGFSAGQRSVGPGDGTPLETADEWGRAAEKVRTPSQIELMLKMFAYYDRHGLRPGNPGILAWLLGRRPTTYAEFVARTRGGDAR